MTKKQNLLAAINRTGPQWVPNGMENTIRLYPPILERPLSAGKDAFGCIWDLTEGAVGGTYSREGDHIVTDLKNWRDVVKFPDVEMFDWEYVQNQVVNLDRSEFIFEGFVEMGLFERSYLLLGMENAMINYMLEPELMFELVSAIADYKIKFIRKFDEMIDLDMVWFGDDWGSQHNLLIPPDKWREIIKPNLKRVYECMKERDIIINQHSCGKIEEIFGDVVELGADIWNMCQPCNDLKKMKDDYGDKISFHGGIDSQFVLNAPDASVEGITAEVKKRITEMSPGGGYIAGPSHTIPSHRPELLEAFYSAIDEYGKNAYR